MKQTPTAEFEIIASRLRSHSYWSKPQSNEAVEFIDQKFIYLFSGCLILKPFDPIVRSLRCFSMHWYASQWSKWGDLDGSLQISVEG